MTLKKWWRLGGVSMSPRFGAALSLRYCGFSCTTSGLRVVALASVIAMMLTATVAAQTPAKPLPSPPPAPKAAAPSGVDTVIALVKGGMSEALVIKTLKREGKAYTLSAADLLKLQKGGVSENIIEVMTDPGAAVTAAAPPAATPAVLPAARPVAESVHEATGAATPFPADLPDTVG